MREDILATKQEKLARLTEVFGTAYPEKTGRTIDHATLLSRFDELAASKECRRDRRSGAFASDDGEDWFRAYRRWKRKIPDLSFRTDDWDGGASSFFAETIEIGDFIEASGTVFLTKKDEKTLDVASWRILSKSMRPIPTEHFGLQDEEERLRRRYLDLLSNP
jgi:lysyl-tRNA synthetase class II